MSFVAVAFTAASTVVNVAGQLAAGRQRRAVADYNAALQESEAENEFLEQKERIARERSNNKKLLARNIALRAASGVDIQSGSSLMLEAQTASALELKALDQKRVSDTRIQRLRSGAKITRLQGKAAQRSSFFQAGASLLGGAARVSGLLDRRVEVDN